MFRNLKVLFFKNTALFGAAFIMANSSIGPGFLTQTTVFTDKLMTSFGFVILISIFIDMGAQLNTWRILTISELRAQDLGNKMFPGLGYLLMALIVVGGFAFNIGNIAGCGLGLNVLFGISFKEGAIISSIVALMLFWIRHTGKMLDTLTPFLGIIKISLTLIIAILAHPPLIAAIHHTIVPEHISSTAIITIVGGTVGGYITFSGAHRLLDAGIKGKESIPQVNKSAIGGIIISALMRFILFLAVVGVLTTGIKLNGDNPAGSIFQAAAGNIGFKIFGVVLWSAAISSVVGASYTSVSFIKTLHPLFLKYEKWLITLFILLSTLVFVIVGKPKQLLILAGVINAMILPFALSVILIAATKKKFMKDYVHPLWMQFAGWVVVCIMSWMCLLSLQELFSKYF